MNVAIEFHDSEIVRVDRAGEDVELELLAYIHQSTGRPGVDPGTGWTQSAVLRVRGASGQASGPFMIFDGSLLVGKALYENVVPASLDVVASCRLKLSGPDGDIDLEGHAVTIELMGEPRFVETYRGS